MRVYVLGDSHTQALGPRIASQSADTVTYEAFPGHSTKRAHTKASIPSGQDTVVLSLGGNDFGDQGAARAALVAAVRRRNPLGAHPVVRPLRRQLAHHSRSPARRAGRRPAPAAPPARCHLGGYAAMVAHRPQGRQRALHDARLLAHSGPHGIRHQERPRGGCRRWCVARARGGVCWVAPAALLESP